MRSRPRRPLGLAIDVSLIRLSNYNCNEFIFPILNCPSFKFVSWLILCCWKLSIDCKYRSNTNLWISVSLTAFRDWKITTCHVSLMRHDILILPETLCRRATQRVSRDMWSRNCLSFRSTWVHARFLVGFMLLVD